MPSLPLKFFDPFLLRQALATRDLVQADDVGAFGQAATVVPTGRYLLVAVRRTGGEAFEIARWACAVECSLDVAAPDVPVAEQSVFDSSGGVCGGEVGEREGVGEYVGWEGEEGEGERCEEGWHEVSFGV
jgi:hypothetical protein